MVSHLNVLHGRDNSSSPGDSPSSQFLDLFSNPFQSQIASDAAVASLITSLAITGAVTLLFCFLRPYNSVVYAPRLRNADEKHAPPAIGRGPFAWIPPLINTDEEQMIEKVGMDAALFLRFIRMCRNMFVVLSFLGCGIIIPANYVGGRELADKYNVSALMKMTPQYMFGTIYWAFVGCAYAINIVVCLFLWWNYRVVAKMRRRYLESADYQNLLSARTLMINDIPRELRSDEGVVKITDELRLSDELPHGSIAHNVKELPELIEEHKKAVRKLEGVLVKVCKKYPNGVPDGKRPMMKPCKKYSKGNHGEKVDAIDYLNQRRQDLEREINEVRLSVDNRNALSYGFASYGSVETAHNVAYASRKKAPQGTQMRLAPLPKDIIWRNMNMPPSARKSRKMWTTFWISVLTIVWVVPNILMAVFLTNLANLGKVLPSFQRELERHPTWWAVVQGVASPAITSLFYFYLPSIFRRLINKSGDRTKTCRERHVTNKLFTFFLINNLILFSLFSTAWQFMTDILQARREHKGTWESLRDAHVFSHVLISLSNMSPYWLSWMLQRNLGAAIDISQVYVLLTSWFMRKFRSPTPRQIIEWTAPPPFDYPSYYTYFLFYTTVALSFATLQPLVLPVTAIYFCIDSWLKKYLIMYVFVTKTESGGLYWRILFNRMLGAVLIGDIVVALIVRANGYSWTMLGVMAGLPLLLFAFKMYCARSFDDQMAYLTRGNVEPDSAVSIDKHARKRDRVGVKFGHPALYQQLMRPKLDKKSEQLVKQLLRNSSVEEEDEAIVGGYSDIYSLKPMARGHAGQPAAPRGRGEKCDMEFVHDSQLDFEHFKNDPEFREEHGGGGELFGRAEDVHRPGTPRTHRTHSGYSSGSASRDASRQGRSGHAAHHDGGRSESRESERTSQDTAGGRTYAPGYHRTPPAPHGEFGHSRNHSGSPGPGPGPRPMARQGSMDDILRDAAPMGRGVTSTAGYGPLRGGAGAGDGVGGGYEL